MSVFSKLSITSLLLAVPGVIAAGEHGTSVGVDKDGKKLTGLDWDKMTGGSKLRLVKDGADKTKPEVIETITVHEGAPTEWTLDGRVVKVSGFKPQAAEEKEPEAKGSLVLETAVDGEEKEITLELGEGNKLDEKVYDQPAQLKKGAVVTMKKESAKGDVAVEYKVKECTLFKAAKAEVPASWKVVSLKDDVTAVEFEKSDKNWVASLGAFTFTLSDDEFKALDATKSVEGVHEKDKLAYAVKSLEPAGADETKKTVNLMLKENRFDLSDAKDLTFTEKNGKMIGAGKTDKMELKVSNRGPKTFESDNATALPDQDAVIQHILTTSKVAGQQWFLELAPKNGGKDDDAWYKSVMNWVYISLAVVAVAVLCFFVFGGKKDTDSDDESDLDTSDDEEEDAAATEAKEEEA